VGKDEKPDIITSLAKILETSFTSVVGIHPYESKKYTREGENKKREVLLIRVGFKDGEICKLDRMLFGHSPLLKTRTHVPPR
jgi:hypothetical protein